MSIVQKLRDEISHRQQQITDIQEHCSHPTSCVTKKAGSSTGNPYNADAYWYECHCDLCDKRWQEDQ